MQNSMSDEPEFRRDPVTGRWGLVAPERSRRPIDALRRGPRHRTDGERTPCPFCPGQEYDTPNEVCAIREPGTRPNGPGWRLRVVPNKFPAVRGPTPPPPAPYPERDEGGRQPSPFPRQGSGPGGSAFIPRPRSGLAEVLIECPEHIDNPTQLYRRAVPRRVPRLPRADDRTGGRPAAGARRGVQERRGRGRRVARPHALAIIATPVVPALIRSELAGAGGVLRPHRAVRVLRPRG